MSKQNLVTFREHLSGFTIIQKNNEKYRCDDHHIFFHGQKLFFTSTIEELKGIKAKKVSGLKRSAQRGRILLRALALESKSLVVNPRFEECYFNLEDSYFLLSQSGKKEYRGHKFKNFVTNGCLFGANLRGVQENGDKLPLIDHQIKIQSPVVDIDVEQAFHPYEINTFKIFSKHLPLMKKIGVDGFKVIYHLPIIDYILFGIRLFIQENISYFALEKYIEQIKIRGKRHKEQLDNIAKQHGVFLLTHSPFENLFAPEDEITAKSLFFALGLDIKTIKKTPPHLVEADMVKNILNLLIGNDYCPHIQKIWQKLNQKNADFKFVQSLTDVLRIANASVIAYATEKNNHEDNKTCVWLSADESPVFNHYKQNMSSIFAEVVGFSFLPAVLNYVGMNPDGAGQQTLFRYRPDIFEALSLKKTILSTPMLKLSPDHYYLSISYQYLFFSFSVLSKINPDFRHIFLLMNLCKIFINDINFTKNQTMLPMVIMNERISYGIFANMHKTKHHSVCYQNKTNKVI